MVVISKFTGKLVSLTICSPPRVIARNPAFFLIPISRFKRHIASLSPHSSCLSHPLTIPQAIALAALATTASATDPVAVPVDPICNAPNDQIQVFPEAISPAIPAPAEPVTLQADCCYKRTYDGYHLGNQVCACKAWDAWCRGRFSTCCGEARACTEYCKCIPDEHYCDHEDNEAETECDNPYEGEGDATWAMGLSMNEAPDCPADL